MQIGTNIPNLQGMNYLHRHLEKTIKDAINWSKVVLLLGARQTGKSTMLRHLFPDYQHITFDPVTDLYGARTDPDFFLNNFSKPLILDEIQYVPQLMPALKRYVDNSERKGEFILTGSQNLMLMQQVSESLAGRVMIFHLAPFTLSEMSESPAPLPFLSAWLNQETDFWEKEKPRHAIMPLLKYLWRGMYPGITELPDEAISYYYQSYLSTYIERDVRLLGNISDEADLGRFMRLLAALTAQELNFSQLGREIFITPKTAKNWLDILRKSYQFLEIPPWKGNAIKRLSGKAKGILTDSGLICFLQQIPSAEALSGHPLYGRLFETWILNRLSTLLSLLPGKPSLYHWRTNGGAEVDAVIHYNQMLYPVEIKGKFSGITKNEISGINAFHQTYANSGPGLLIYAGDENYPLSRNAAAISWKMF